MTLVDTDLALIRLEMAVEHGGRHDKLDSPVFSQQITG